MTPYFHLNPLGGILLLTRSIALTKKIEVFLQRNASSHPVNLFLEVSEAHSGNIKCLLKYLQD